MEVDVSRGPVRFQLLDQNAPVEETPDQSLMGMLRDGYALGVYGQIKDEIDKIMARRNSVIDPNYDPLDNIPKGYERYADAYTFAMNQAEADQITDNINENLAIRQRQSQLGFGTNLMVGLVTGIFDPVNLIPVPGLKGLGFVQGALKGGASIGSINAAQELVRNELDATSTNTETAINIGLGYLVAGAISGGIGHFTRNHRGTVDLEPSVREKAEAAGDRFARAQAAVDGLEVKDVFDYNGQGVRIVEGNTGKYDQNGNYIRAFFRPKEALEAEARRVAVSRAADDALGDVIPETAAGRAATPEEAMAPQRAGQAADEPASEAAPMQMEEIDPTTGQPRMLEPEGALAREGSSEPKAAVEPEDTIFIDSSAILSEFEAKPWTNPRYEGIEPLAEDAFKSPQEWLNFVVLHELNHKTTKRLPSESKAVYENRINRLAYDEVQAGRLPLSPTDSALEKLMLLPTPSGTLMRLAPRQRETHELAQGIAGDMSTLTLANRAGRPTTPGGSVFQRAQRWLTANYVMSVQWQKAYVRYVTGKEASGVASNAFETFRLGMPLVGQAKRTGKLTPQEFRDYVGRAVYDDQPFEIHGKPLSDEDMVIVQGAAREARQLFEQFRIKAQELGMFESQKKLQREVDWRTKANERDARRLEKLKPGSRLHDEISAGIKERTAGLKDAQDQLDSFNADAVRPAGEQYYFPRIYDLTKVRARYDEFVKLVGESYGGTAEAFERAKVTAQKILGNNGEEFVPGVGGPRNLLGREIPLTNKELTDFIIHDIETVMGLYSRRMGASIEMVGKYGSRMIDDQLDSLKATLQDQGYDAKTIQKIIQQEEDLRDRVLGRFHGKDPMSWDNRVARGLKNYGNLTLMGRGIYSQTMDVARTVATEGFSPLFKALHTAMRGEMVGMSRGAYAKQAGEAMELVNARWMAQMIDNDSALTVTNQTMLERGLAAAQSPFFKLNMMNPFTVVWKEFTSIMTTHTLLDEANTVANAVRAGRTMGTFSKKELKQAQHLASWGIDLRGAQMIADMPIEKTEGSGLYLANIENWTGRDGERARELFLGALSGNIRSAVVTPGPLQRAAIMDGVFTVKGKRVEAPLLSLPFQLMSFTMASSAKITHSMLSGRDRNIAVTLGALMVGGMFATWLKSGDNFEKMGWDEFALNSIENSSVLGWLADVYKRTEDLTGYGPRSAMGLKDLGENAVSDEIGVVAGPATSVLAGAVEAFVNPELEARQQAAMIRRAVPFSGIVWWSDLLKEWSNWAADAGMVDTAVGDGVDMDMSEEETVELVG
jgi:hypothetical protein